MANNKRKTDIDKAADLMLEIAKNQEAKENTATVHPQTSHEQVRESGRKIISTIICAGFVIVVLLLIIGSCAS